MLNAQSWGQEVDFAQFLNRIIKIYFSSKKQQRNYIKIGSLKIERNTRIGNDHVEVSRWRSLDRTDSETEGAQTPRRSEPAPSLRRASSPRSLSQGNTTASWLSCSVGPLKSIGCGWRWASVPSQLTVHSNTGTARSRRHTPQLCLTSALSTHNPHQPPKIADLNSRNETVEVVE